jgi:hypothetical protein
VGATRPGEPGPEPPPGKGGGGAGRGTRRGPFRVRRGKWISRTGRLGFRCCVGLLELGGEFRQPVASGNKLVVAVELGAVGTLDLGDLGGVALYSVGRIVRDNRASSTADPAP